MSEKTKTKPKISAVENGLEAIRLIREKEGKKRGVTGEVPCPACSKPFRYSIASYNGHIHGRCTGCELSFMM